MRQNSIWTSNAHRGEEMYRQWGVDGEIRDGRREEGGGMGDGWKIADTS